MIKIHDKSFKLAIPHDEIIRAVEELAVRLKVDYEGRIPIFIGVLNGAFMFMSELLKRLDFPLEAAFVKVASYRGTRSLGVVEELIGLTSDVRGRHILVVEDIIETGHSIDFILDNLRDSEAASIEVATMFFKPEIYAGHAAIKYHAMDIPHDFIVGFGLDYDGLGRNLKDVYKVVE